MRRLNLALIFFIATWFDSTNSFPWTRLLLILLILFQNQTLRVIQDYSLIVLLTVPQFLRISRSTTWDDILRQPLWSLFEKKAYDLPVYLTKVSTTLCCLLFLYSLFKWTPRRWQNSCLLAFSALVLVLLKGTDPAPIKQFQFVSFIMVMFLGRYLLTTIYIRNKYPRWRPQTFGELLFLVVPAWQADLPNWDVKPIAEVKDPPHSDQLRHLKLIIITGLIGIGTSFLNTLFFSPQYLGFTNLNSVDFNVYAVQSSTMSQLWISVLFRSFNFVVFSLLLPANLIALMLNTVGIQTRLGVRNVFAAKSFGEFFSCLFTFYSDVLIHVFYIPLLKKFRFLSRWNRTRSILCLGLSIFLMAMIYHALRDSWQFLLGSPVSFDVFFFEYIYYSAGLAICILGFRPFDIFFSFKWISYARVPTYFVIYSLLLCLPAITRQPLSLSWFVLKRLFGIPT